MYNQTMMKYSITFLILMKGYYLFKESLIVKVTNFKQKTAKVKKIQSQKLSEPKNWQ